MKQLLFFLLVLSAFVFFSCEEKQVETKYYYALDSLLNEQVIFLSQSKASLLKKATLDDKQELKTLVPDTSLWKFELDVFAQLNDINKPTNASKYRTERDVKDATSNLLIYSIESIEKLPVSYLKVYYLNTLSDIRKIEGVYREESSLLNSARHLSMEFQNINNKIVLTSYSMTGGQKMLVGDSVQFSVHGTITLP